jgi:hypothetical protein
MTLALLAGVSCTLQNTTPTETPALSSADQPALLLGSLLGDGLFGEGLLEDGLRGDELLGGTLTDLGRVLGSAELLNCTPQPYASTSKKIGPDGGVIVVGTHRLVIPQGALRTWFTIKAEQITGSANSVRFHPQGLRFDEPAKLTMSYENCSQLIPLPKKIVYTTEKLKLLEILLSLDLFEQKSVTAPIDHFSRYAIAY